MHEFFSRWQSRSIGRMVTFLLGALTATVAVWLLGEVTRSIAFLQPVLIPLAIAAVLAFLLEPVVRALCARTRFSRTQVVLMLMVMVALAAATAGVWVVPRAYASGVTMLQDLPSFMRKAEDRLFAIIEGAQKKVDGLNKTAPVAPPEAVALKTPAGTSGDLNKNGHLDEGDLRVWLSGQLPKLGAQAPELLRRAGAILLTAFGGFMGAFGVLLNVIIIPIYVFFMLTEAPRIARRWADFLPLKDSRFKEEVVITMSEIHGYLIAFFRGQLLVSTIDAALIASSLWLFVGLNFSVVIGLLVLVLTFIPYLGILLCYVPAVLIAVVQFGDWQHPAAVLAIMFGVQTLESTIIAPKIVGESTGLHPLTVIVSVFAWELILNGPIGALLAVPLTAALKVIMKRYVWERARSRSRIVVPAEAELVPAPVKIQSPLY